MKNLLAGNIARYRKGSKLTQEELGGKLGVTYQAVSKWETGQTLPDASLLPALASALGVSIDKLFGYGAPQKGGTFYDSMCLWGSPLLTLAPKKRSIHTFGIRVNCWRITGIGSSRIFRKRFSIVTPPAFLISTP